MADRSMEEHMELQANQGKGQPKSQTTYPTSDLYQQSQAQNMPISILPISGFYPPKSGIKIGRNSPPFLG